MSKWTDAETLRTLWRAFTPHHGHLLLVCGLVWAGDYELPTGGCPWPLFPHLGIRAAQPLRGLIGLDTISEPAPLRVGKHPWIWFSRKRELVQLVPLEPAVRGNLA